YCRASPRIFPSFPTRRSSDLLRARCHESRQPISRLMTRASVLPAAGCSTGLVTYRSPVLGVACPLREIRASITTLSNCESRRERSEEHTSELQSRRDLVCRLL